MTQQYRLFIADQTPEPSINPSNALVMGIGTSSGRAQANAASRNFLSFYFENFATSGDNRGMYLRQYLSGAGSGGEAARIFSTINNVAVGTAHGAHVSLSFADTGTVTGLGVAMRATLHIANQATQNGTLAPIQGEIWSDGSTSDPAGSTLSFIRLVNGGDATGGADVDDDVALFDLSGVTIASGNLVEASTTEANYSHSVKVRINGTLYYMMLASTAG